jgi:hypothetical protein
MPNVVEIETIMLTKDVEYLAEAKDQGKALDEAVAWATAKGWELVSIILDEEKSKDKGHVFIVTYNKTATAMPVPMSRRNRD